MKKILDCILLIDDSAATNFINTLIIENSGCTKKCIAIESGEKALEFLKSKENGNHPQPDLIFLDINMPEMNGWEFIEEYNKLDQEMQSKIIIVMLTTSVNPDDKEKAKTYKKINSFKIKPLSFQGLEDILHEYFPENF